LLNEQEYMKQTSNQNRHRC